MVEGNGAPMGKLYCLQGSEAAVCLTDIAISNSICFSPDGQHLYFSDTPRRTILRYDIDAAGGAVSNRRIFAQTPPGAFPDGANVDAEGHVWNAHWGAGRVVRYAPDGEISVQSRSRHAADLHCIRRQGSRSAVRDFGAGEPGPAALAREPHAGDVFVYRLGVKGLSDPRFAQDDSGDAPNLSLEKCELPMKTASALDVNQAAESAASAFYPYSRSEPALRARFLRAIAQGIEALGDPLIECAAHETALPVARLQGERGRTCMQLRLFADMAADNAWIDEYAETADPARKPQPRPYLRSRFVPLGPVVVFGASNFPLAFSVAGGDTASALAVGCPSS